MNSEIRKNISGKTAKMKVMSRVTSTIVFSENTSWLYKILTLYKKEKTRWNTKSLNKILIFRDKSIIIHRSKAFYNRSIIEKILINKCSIF